MSAWIVRRRYWLLAALLCITAGLSVGLPAASVPDNSLTVWFLETDPALERYEALHDRFGNDELIMIELEAPDVFAPEVLERVQAATERIEAIDGVYAVHSLLSVRDAVTGATGLKFEKLLTPEVRADDEARAQARAQMLDNPLFADRLVAQDGKHALLWVELDVMDDIDARRDALVAAVRTEADAALGELPHPVAGIGVIFAGLNEVVQRDFGLFTTLAYLLIFSCLWVAFRSWRIVIATLGVALIAVVACMGAYGLAGHQLNMVTVVLPTVLIVLGVADAIHFPAASARVSREQPHLDPPSHAAAVVKRLLWPCALTSLTTVIGFAALGASPMAVLRQLGLYTALGVAFAFVTTLILMPLALGGRGPRPDPRPGRLERVLERLAQLVVEHPRRVMVGSAAVVALALLGATRVDVDTYTIGYLPDDHQVVTDHEQIEAGWGPYTTLELTIETPDATADSAAVLRATEAFVEEATKHEDISRGFSAPLLYRRMADVLSDGSFEGPLNDQLVAQLNLVLSMQRFEWDRSESAFHDNVLAPFVGQDRKVGRATFVIRMMSAAELTSLIGWLETTAEQHYGELAQAHVTGYPALYVSIIDHVVASQTRSFGLALALIFGLMWLTLRSVRLALLSLVPNVLPVVAMLGVMGAMGMDLDITTATIAAIIIGVAIDDTIHFLWAWRAAETEGLSWAQTVPRVLLTAGRPAATTTLLLVLGFSTLMVSDVGSVYAFGLLTSVGAVAALLADIFVLPVLLGLVPALEVKSWTRPSRSHSHSHVA